MKKFNFLILLLLFVSCTTTKYVEVPVETIKNNYINTILKDTIIIKDSVDRWLKGDTVWITKYKYVYNTVYKQDTVFKTDTIPKTVYVEKIITVNELKNYLKFLIYAGLLFVFLFIFAIYKKLKL